MRKGEDSTVRPTLDFLDVSLPHVFVGCDQEPRVFGAKADYKGVLNTLFSLFRASGAREAIVETMHNETVIAQGRGGFSVTKSVVKKQRQRITVLDVLRSQYAEEPSVRPQHQGCKDRLSPPRFGRLADNPPTLLLKFGSLSPPNARREHPH
jgi:hypothetical protein